LPCSRISLASSFSVFFAIFALPDYRAPSLRLARERSPIRRNQTRRRYRGSLFVMPRLDRGIHARARGYAPGLAMNPAVEPRGDKGAPG
jgi:hypothetical protein